MLILKITNIYSLKQINKNVLDKGYSLNRDKLKSDRIGVRDYIDKNFEINEIELKIENITRLISWQKQNKKF